MPTAATTETPVRDWTVATATITFADRGGDRQFVSVVYSDGREPVQGLVYHSDREGADCPEQWMEEDLLSAPSDVWEAFLTRGNADGSPMIVEVPSVFEALELSDGWCVRDNETASYWWPNGASESEIAISDNPEQTALRLCHEQPSAGEWT